MSDYKTFTSEDLMKATGLQVGDRVKIKFEVSNIIDGTITTEERILNIVSDNHLGVGLEHNGVIVPVERILNRGFKILPRPKRVGDLKCDNECFRNNGQCPIRAICSHCNLMRSDKTLYEFLEFYKGKKDKYANEVEFDQEIYDLLKARLDKEVEE